MSRTIIVPSGENKILKKIEILKFISETHRKIHDNRIERELKVVFTTISFYIASALVKLRGELIIKNPEIKAIIILGFVAIAAGALYYLKSSGEANRINQDKAEKAELILSKYLNIKEDNYKRNGHPCANRDIWQISLVLLAAFISILVFYHE